MPTKWDKSRLKEACQRGLAIGRTRQEFDLQLLLDMLLEIESLEEVQICDKCDLCEDHHG